MRASQAFVVHRVFWGPVVELKVEGLYGLGFTRQGFRAFEIFGLLIAVLKGSYDSYVAIGLRGLRV